jgi:uncharacterized protein involved in outer membrane biogenesis
MKKLRKMLIALLGAVVILLAIVVVLINLFADRAVKIGIETAATKALNVGVSVDDVKLSIMAGKLTLGNLVINNPPGYQYDKLLQLQNAKIAVDIRSLLSDTVNIKEIKLDGAQVVLEQRGVSGNNIQDIIKSMPSSPKTQEQTQQPSGKKLHIDNLEISNITVKAKLLPIPGKADTVTLKLAPIKMTNLGGDNKLDTAALSGKILWAIAEGVAQQGAGVLPDDMLGSLKSTIAKTAELGKEVLKTGENLGKEVLKTTEDLGKELTEGLKGLLKPKKEE